MVENQHRLIKGYRDLSQEEINQMNIIKELAEKVNEALADLVNHIDTDSRWLAIGKTNLQQGFMAVTRSITRPDFF